MKNLYSVSPSFIQSTIRNALSSGQLTVNQLDVIGDMYHDAFRETINGLRACQRMILPNSINEDVQRKLQQHHVDLLSLLLDKYDYNVDEFVKAVKVAKPLGTTNDLGIITYLTNLAKLIDYETNNAWLFWLPKNVQLKNTQKVLLENGLLD